ncbi:NifU family protein [Streptomyces sp. CC228A]|uniref:NifU family protein n=1 Tax=Streptomyces sp. CC228A TaxID=2898186 RepID=UPI001F439CDE|nr:NifU family protein [Streptomyces sp. CC228A]
MADRERLDAAAVADRLARVDDRLGRVEAAPGPTSDAALHAVRALTEVYGEALARVLDHADPQLTAALTADELLAHLLVLHDLHPDPVDRRVADAVEALRPALREQGGDISLEGVEGGVARVRLSTGGGCGSGCGTGGAGGGVEEAVREAVLAMAPELTDVQAVPDRGAAAPAFVPLATLTRRPAPVPQETP